MSSVLNERTNDYRIVFSLEDSGGFPPEEEKSEFQLKTEENCKLQTAQGMLHCYMKPGGRSWLEKVPVAEETTKKTALRMLLLRDRRLETVATPTDRSDQILVGKRLTRSTWRLCIQIPYVSFFTSIFFL